MTIIGKVASLWRYPVKSMHGEQLERAFVGYPGVYGDRLFAFRSAARSNNFPYMTARVQRAMLQYRPQFRNQQRSLEPPYLAETQRDEPGNTPLPPETGDLTLDVVTPDGAVLAVDDPALLALLGDGLKATEQLSLMRAERAMSDCRPVSLFSLQTAAQIGTELGSAIDPRRFRANIYADFDSLEGFAENGLVGRSLRIGERAMMTVVERDARCVMISLDPDTGAADPQVLRTVAQAHEGIAGVYCAVLVEGVVRAGDPIVLVE